MDKKLWLLEYGPEAESDERLVSRSCGGQTDEALPGTGKAFEKFKALEVWIRFSL